MNVDVTFKASEVLAILLERVPEAPGLKAELVSVELKG